MSFYVISDKDTLLGFNLVGVSGKAVSTVEEARDEFARVVSEKKAKILVITEKTAELIRREVRQQMMRMTFPFVVEIPDRSGPLPGKKSVSEMITEAIGVRI